MSNKIYVYSKDTVPVKRAFVKACSIVSPSIEFNNIISIRNIKSFTKGLKHSKGSVVISTDSQSHKKLGCSTLLEISDTMSVQSKTKVFEEIKTIIKTFLDQREDKDFNILDINIDSFTEILDKDGIKKFIEQFRDTYKKPILIETKDNKTVAVFDNEIDFESQKDNYDILITVNEYVAIMLSTLAFNAKGVKIERKK